MNTPHRSVRWPEATARSGGAGRDLTRHPLLEAFPALGRLGLTALGRRHSDEIFEQVPRDVRDLGDRVFEGFGIRLRRLGRAADLAHVLQRGGMHLVVGGRGFEVMKNVDATAHVGENTPAPAAEDSRLI